MCWDAVLLRHRSKFAFAHLFARFTFLFLPFMRVQYFEVFCDALDLDVPQLLVNPAHDDWEAVADDEQEDGLQFQGQYSF